jgi:hypothetical protein
MKTKVRIIRSSKPADYYQHVNFQFLAERYPNSKSLETFCTLTWQTDPDNKHWYAFKVILETERIEHIEFAVKMVKYLAKKLGKNYLSSVTPEDVLQALKPELYGYSSEGDFQPMSMDGCNLYHVRLLSKPDSIWTRVYAFTLEEAAKQAEDQEIKDCTVTLYKEHVTVVADSHKSPYEK